MALKATLTMIILALSASLLANLECSDLSFPEEEQPVVFSICSSCTQWASGKVEKDDTAGGGPLCLFISAADSYNVCDPTTILYLGSEWNEDCYTLGAADTSISWNFSSRREDWQAEEGSWALLFLYVPCFTPATNNQLLEWTTICPYCPSCQ